MTECDELLDFVSGLNYEKYIEDVEVNQMVKAIKTRIDEIKKEKDNNENWKEDAAKRLDKNNQNDDNENKSYITLGEAKSVASEKTIRILIKLTI